MSICVTWRGTDLFLEAAPAATVADLCRVLPDRPDVVWVDGREAASDMLLSQIPNGAVLDQPFGSDQPLRTYQEGRSRFNRPPRVGAPALPAPPPVPKLPVVPERRFRFAWATLALSVVAGALFAMMFGPAMALFSLLGAAMAVGSWVEAKSEARRELRTAHESYVRDTARYVAEHVRWTRKRQVVLRRQMPGPEEVISRAAQIEPALWERRPGHADFGLVSVGVMESTAPVGMVLSDGVTIGVVGDRDVVMGVMRWILVQLAVHQGPADLSLDALPHPQWDWLKWLPHAGRSVGLVVCVTEGNPAPSPAVNLVIANTLLELPGGCDRVIDVEADGDGTVTLIGDGTRRHLSVTQITENQAVTVARALARLRDPEDRAPTAGTGPVRLQELLGFPSAEQVVRRWRDARRLRAPLGRGPSGVMEIDLDSDGPHGLLAGTTGSGKSELLRSLVLSFAASLPPSRLVFVLIDYKGGSTFDKCATLPHVVGSLTDLDGMSARRALEGLKSELRDRETLLRECGAEDLHSYEGTPPIPHLLVIIDEFAALAEQAPDTLDGLIDIARRGRSLGMHLLLATQRPAGVVSDRIRANTALRIALRVHDPADSEDVIGVSDAARINRHMPGRGLLRLGPGELVAFQAAIATAPSGTGAVRLARFLRGRLPQWEGGESASGMMGFIETIQEAAALSEEPRPDPIWTPELPETVALSALPTATSSTRWSVPFGLIDDTRSRRALVWEGANVLFVGAESSESARALAALVMAVCRHHPDTHVHIIGAQDDHLVTLERIPQVGNVVSPAETERQDRLLFHLIEVIERRSTRGGSSHPVLLVAEGFPTNALFQRVVSEGSRVGVFAAVSIRGAGAISGTQMAFFPERLAFRLADPYEYVALGLDRTVQMAPGTAVQIASGRLVRIAEPATEAVAGHGERPVVVAALPRVVQLAGLAGGAVQDRGAWFIPAGLGGRSVLRPVGFRLDRGRHVVITGRRGAGKTTALETIAAAANGKIPVTIVAIGDRAEDIAYKLDGDEERLCLVDDADRLDLDLHTVPKNVHLVATAATGRLGYGHWLRKLVPDAEGLVLEPDHRDEDLWQIRLASSSIPGRGVLINGENPIPIQVASGTMAAQCKEDPADACSNRNR